MRTPMTDSPDDERRELNRRPFRAGRCWPWVLAALVAVMVRLPDFWLPMNRDGGVFAYGGWRVLHGELPYLHFWDNKLPGVFYINALAIRLFGASVGGLVVFQMLYGAATALTFLAVGRRICGHKAALITALIFAFYHGGYGLNEEGNFTESYIALPALAAVLLLVDWSRERRGCLIPAIAGALGLAAGLIKQPAAAVVPAMVLFVAFSGSRRSRYAAAAAVLAGAAAVWALFVLWLVSKGILSAAIDANIVYNRLYLIDAYTSGSPVVPWNLLRGIVLAALPLAGAIAGTVATAFRPPTSSPAARQHEDGVRGVGWLLVPWFLIDLVGVASGGRFYSHYFVAVLPSALLLTGVFIDSLPRTRASVWAAGAAGLFLFFGPVWSVGSSSPENRYTPVTSIAMQEHRAVQWVLERRLALGVTSAAEDIAAWVGARTSPSDTIYVWGHDPRIGFLARRAFPCRYVHVHPLAAGGFNRDARIRELARALAARRPEYIVDQSAILPLTAPPLDSPHAPPSKYQFFRLDGYEPVKEVVARDYRPVARVRGCVIFGLR